MKGYRKAPKVCAFSATGTVAITILVGCLLLSGCVHSSEATWRGHGRVKQYNKYLAEQNWTEVLKTVRAEIADPESQGKSHLTIIRMYGIEALGRYVKAHGLQPGFDEEAGRYYKEGLGYADQDELQQARINYTLGYYYSQSRRNGLAIPYFKKDLEYSLRINDTFRVILGYHNLAATYSDMGETALRDHYRKKALGLAEPYFVLGVNPSKPNEWVQYYTILRTRADNIANSGNISEAALLWSKIEPITNKYIRPKYVPYTAMAKMFAISGDLKRATALHQQAQAVWQQESERHGQLAQVAQLDFACTDGHLQLLGRQYAAAIQAFERCMALRSSLRMLESEPAIHRLRGLAYEGVGDLSRAADAYAASITEFEKTRSSYSVAERASFFRTGPIRRSYWGLIRTLAKRATGSGNEEDFLAALQATEMIRARQLGELADSQAEAAMSTQSLRALRSQLGPDTVILDYILMDEHIILLAFDKDHHLVLVMPYDGKDLGRQLRTIAEALSDAHSSVTDIQRRLSDTSKVLVVPVAPLLDKKTQVLVLPDGVLNLIPFDLLSVNQSSYRPLTQDKVVWVASSLKLFRLNQDRVPHSTNASLFALGDPVYAKAPLVAGLSQTELETVTRGHAYLSYFSPLPETRTEVESIAKLFGNESAKLVLGEQARESTFKNANLQSFRYIHLATHGILGGEVPGIGEPALVLGEEPEEDGFLRASEVETMKLNADLTVLSACKTGTGELVTGEGVLGMSRAFLVAGSRSVLVSLWSVASKETEQLMVAFYRHLRSGMDTAEALRKAKLELMAQHPHPFYWAPFILVGR